MHATTTRHKKTEWPHITLNKDGMPCIDGTRFKVDTVVIDHVQNGLTIEEIQRIYPPLSLAQVHAALLYYYDHKAAIDRKIADDDAFSEQMRAENPNRLSGEDLLDRFEVKRSHRGIVSNDAA